jgi:NADH dehydrogenase (ubiquinone) 1 alpha/beta subcomplex 1
MLLPVARTLLRAPAMPRLVAAPRVCSVRWMSSSSGAGLPEQAKTSDFDPHFLDRAEVLGRVKLVLQQFERVDKSKLTDDAKFADLGLDSLDSVEVVMALEEEFSIEIEDNAADKINSIKDAVDFVASSPLAKW